MPPTQHESALSALQIPFAIPSEAAFRTELTEPEFRLLLLAGIGAVSTKTGSVNAGTRTGSSILQNLRTIATTETTLTMLHATNMGPAQYIQIHEGPTAPVNTAVPLATYPVPSGGVLFLNDAIKCAGGLHVCNSTTAATLTLGAADCWFLATTV